MKDNRYISKGKAKKDKFIGRKVISSILHFFSIKTNKNKDCHREAEEINNFLCLPKNSSNLLSSYVSKMMYTGDF